MLDVILQILSVIGIILLVLLILVLVVLALVLFFPITYRFYGTKQEEIQIIAKVKWLFGLLRVSFFYPDTGKLTVKALWFTLYETMIPGEKETDGNAADAASAKEKETSGESGPAIPEHPATTENSETTDTPETNESQEESPEEEGSTLIGKILQKIEQIKYTISNLCDKIKEIWKNINYYVELLKEEDTKALFRHVLLRVGNILKSIRPRHIEADILFGTGSPDTTGYAYAAYGMLMSVLGPKVIVEPDFEQAVLKGELKFSGHITIWVLLINGLKILLDKKLHRFIKKVKAGVPKKAEDKSNENVENKAANKAETKAKAAK